MSPSRSKITSDLAKMNAPNWVTLSRIPFLFLIAGLLYVPWSGTATLTFILFLIAGGSDWLDGYLARKLRQVSNFGKLMDALTDKVLMVGLFIALLGIDILPRWSVFLVMLIIAREFLVTGLRLVAATQGKVLSAERTGKFKTVMQIVCVGLLLFAYAAEKDFSTFLSPSLIKLAYDAGIATFVLATLLTILSGIQYIIKYWSFFINDAANS